MSHSTKKDFNDFPKMRAYCYRCMRVSAMCLCSELLLCDNRTTIHVLQDRKEKRHAFGTVRLLKVALKNIQIHEVRNGKAKGIPKPDAIANDAGVLYPGPNSIEISSIPHSERPTSLVVVDGTWSQAHRMVRDSPWLGKLKRYCLSPKEPSRYKIRKEPRHECLSTLESTAMALSFLEPDTEGIDTLWKAFDVMNQRQVDCMQENAGGPKRFKKERPRPMRAVPSVLWNMPERVILVYAESAFSNHQSQRKTREIAQWCAVSLTDSRRVFDSIVKTMACLPTEEYRETLQWGPIDKDSLETLQKVKENWLRFLKPNDIVFSWNKGTLRLGEFHGLVHDGKILKEVYGNTTKDRFGTLDQVVQERHLVRAESLKIRGRAAKRLANARSVALYLGQWARDRQNID